MTIKGHDCAETAFYREMTEFKQSKRRKYGTRRRHYKVHRWLVLVALMLKGTSLGVGWISWQSSTMSSVSGGSAVRLSGLRELGS
jgi:hypothetical protein